MKRLLTILLFASPWACPALLSADMMTYWGMGLHEPMVIHSPGLFTDGESINAGQRRAGFDGQFYWGYCVDLTRYAGNSEAQWQDVTERTNGLEVAYLFDTYSEGVTTDLQAAALGVAIWELLYETGPTFDAADGNFYVTGDPNAIEQANVLLDNIPDPFGPYTPRSRIIHCENAQDFIVPEPGTLILMGIGAMSLLVRRSRRWMKSY